MPKFLQMANVGRSVTEWRTLQDFVENPPMDVIDIIDKIKDKAKSDKTNPDNDDMSESAIGGHWLRPDGFTIDQLCHFTPMDWCNMKEDDRNDLNINYQRKKRDDAPLWFVGAIWDINKKRRLNSR